MLLLILTTTLLVELLLYTPLLWLHRQALSSSLALVTFVLGGGMLRFYWGPPALLLAVLSLFRVANLLRITVGRIPEKALLRRTARSSAVFGLMSAGAVLLINNEILVSFSHGLLVFLVYLQLVAALMIWLITLRNVVKSRYDGVVNAYADSELPSVTVAIPARNETPELKDCLQSVLASDYPKLEIIVLDDCSHDKTAQVIKSFAHQGVRFVRGEVPKNGWLAKNQAYEKLAAEASGTYVLFCGVDVRFGSQAIRQLVSTALGREKSMVSVLPQRLAGSPATAFIQPMRYWWELALPRRLLNRPPVLSTCWLINRGLLKKCGGLAAFANSILPERYFAREAIKHDGYSFIRAAGNMDIRTVKGLEAQRRTAIRTRYPQLRRRPETVLLVLLGLGVLLLTPFFILLVSLFMPLAVASWPLYTTCLLLLATHVLIVAITNSRNVPLALINFPLTVVVELVLITESMLKYEFSTVEWRGRNICIPVMQVIPKLPAT